MMRVATLCLLLQGYGVKADPQASEGYNCKSSLRFASVMRPTAKGLDLDDTTMQNCPSKMPLNWPHTDVPVTSIRLFQPWKSDWGPEGRQEFWDQLVTWVKRNSAKVLLGTAVSCFKEDDDREWEWNKQLLKLLGPEHIMGLAVGNELELLSFQAPEFHTPDCMEDLWEKGRFFQTTVERARDMDALGQGFDTVPVTSVFGGYALAGAVTPFVNAPTAMVNSYLVNATKHFGKRWAFTFNVYPYYNPANALDPGTIDQCSHAIDSSVCYTPECNVPASTRVCRQKMQELGAGDYRLWLGETGWSWPKANTLKLVNGAMNNCSEFSSERVFREAYAGYLKWDLNIGDLAPPDHMFWFTMRDALNFKVAEHFGLISTCSSVHCKMQAGEPLGVAKYEVLVM